MRAEKQIILCLSQKFENHGDKDGHSWPSHFGNVPPYQFLPPVYRSPDGEEVVIVRDASGALPACAAVQTKIGAGEAVVVVPKKSIFDACHVMLYGNIKTASPE